MRGQIPDKPVYSAVDLDLYHGCPRRYFYGLRVSGAPADGAATQPGCPSTLQVELPNCHVIVPVASPGTKHADGSDNLNTRRPFAPQARWLEDIFSEQKPAHSALAPGQALRYSLAAAGIARGRFDAHPRSRAFCRGCAHRWTCPE